MIVSGLTSVLDATVSGADSQRARAGRLLAQQIREQQLGVHLNHFTALGAPLKSRPSVASSVKRFDTM